jgi:hypothetical protein
MTVTLHACDSFTIELDIRSLPSTDPPSVWPNDSNIPAWLVAITPEFSVSSTASGHAIITQVYPPGLPDYQIPDHYSGRRAWLQIPVVSATVTGKSTKGACAPSTPPPTPSGAPVPPTTTPPVTTPTSGTTTTPFPQPTIFPHVPPETSPPTMPPTSATAPPAGTSSTKSDVTTTAIVTAGLVASAIIFTTVGWAVERALNRTFEKKGKK